MTRAEYANAKTTLANVNDVVRDGHLTPEDRVKLEALSVTLTERLIAPWFPLDWWRRGIVVALAAGGFYGLWAGAELLVWGWPLALIFSPRIIGGNFHSVR